MMNENPERVIVESANPVVKDNQLLNWSCIRRNSINQDSAYIHSEELALSFRMLKEVHHNAGNRKDDAQSQDTKLEYFIVNPIT